MLADKKIIVVMPAFNAADTLAQTYKDIVWEIVDEVILVDDGSSDNTVSIAQQLGIQCFVHSKNSGYGANQKTCYKLALKHGADIVVMIHPDYQYTPKIAAAMAGLITSGIYDAAIGSRVLGRGARSGGMPLYKYVSNRLLTVIQNICVRRKMSEYHTGYRAFSRDVLLKLPLEENSDGFLFDNEMLAQLIYFGFDIGEVSCPARYFKGASSIDFRESIKYGLGVLYTSLRFLLARHRVGHWQIFSVDGRKLDVT